MQRIAVGAALLAATAAHAQKFGDWTVEKMEGDASFYAATMNSTGGLLGKVCTFDGCKWVVTLQATCDRDAHYPALLASKAGAAHVSLVCEPNEKTPGRYVFSDYDIAEKAFAAGDSTGLAFPMDDGGFRVSRFSLRGMTAAVTQLAVRVRDLVRQGGERRL